MFWSGSYVPIAPSLLFTKTSNREKDMTHQIKTEPGIVGYLLILAIFVALAGPALA